MKWAESATKHSVQLHCMTLCDSLAYYYSACKCCTLYLWNVSQAAPCYFHSAYVEHEIKALHTRVTHLQSSTRWLHTAKCTLHTTELTINCTLHTAHWTTHCTSLSAPHTLHTALSSVLSVQSTLLAEPCSTLPSSFDQKSEVISAATTPPPASQLHQPHS